MRALRTAAIPRNACVSVSPDPRGAVSRRRMRSPAGMGPSCRTSGGMLREASPTASGEPVSMAEVAALLQVDSGDIWTLILALGRLQEVVEQAARSLELSLLAKYAFTLAQHFNRFYHGYPILQAATPADRALRILVADAFRRQLQAAAELLGIPVPRQM